MLLDTFYYLYKERRAADSALEELKRAEENVERVRRGLPPKERLEAVIRRLLAPVLPWHSHSPPRNFYERVLCAETKEGAVARAVLTFLMGELVGLLMFFVIALKYAAAPAPTGTYVGVATQMGVALMLFSPLLRCIALLSIPELTSKRSRELIILIVIICAFQGPAANTSLNIRRVVESVACVQTQIEQGAQEVRDESNRRLDMMALEPLRHFRDSILEPKQKMKNLMRGIHDSLESMVETVKTHWKKMEEDASECSKLMLTPYWYCRRLMLKAKISCDDTIWWRFRPLCNLIWKIEQVCSTARVLGRVCELPAKVKQSMQSGTLLYFKSGIDHAMNETKRAFWYDINHNYSIQADVELDHANLTDMQTELRQRIDYYERIFATLSVILNLLFGALIAVPLFKAIYYVHLYKTYERVDNYFITKQLVMIDETRDQRGQETILPLLPREESQYTTPYSLRIVHSERVELIVSLARVVLCFVIPTLLILIDIVVFEFSDAVYDYFGSNTTLIEVPSFYSLKVAGDGLVAKLYGALLSAFAPIDEQLNADSKWRGCFTEATPPDYAFFRTMCYLMVVCLALCVAQVYVMRIRHLIADQFYPERRRPRALELYNRILKSRGTLLQTITLAAKRKGGIKGLLQDRVGGRLPVFGQILSVFGRDYEQCCRCARADLSKADPDNYRMCMELECQAVYCVECYVARRSCIMCGQKLTSMITDLIEEADSSGDEADDDNAATTKKIPSAII
uniref:Dendritic cell-specific transmembrane protein-like domain-containing protein n=2 Tax=Plectus sambesii TaxID=2011161 RepID=A0A914W208_9BILA